MNKYFVKLEVELEVDAFTYDDAADYVQDIFNVDDEIKKVTVINIKEN